MAEARETAEEQPAQPVLARADAVAPSGVSLQAGISFSPAAVVALQRAAGNRAVSALVSRSARHAVGGAVAEGVREEELDELGRRLGGTGTTDMRVTGQPLAVQRDLAIAPTVPDAAVPVLTEAEIERAIRYNAAPSSTRSRSRSSGTCSGCRSIRRCPIAISRSLPRATRRTSG